MSCCVPLAGCPRSSGGGVDREADALLWQNSNSTSSLLLRFCLALNLPLLLTEPITCTTSSACLIDSVRSPCIQLSFHTPVLRVAACMIQRRTPFSAVPIHLPSALNGLSKS